MKTTRSVLAGLVVVLLVLLVLSGTRGLTASPDIEPVPLPVWRSEVIDPGVAFNFLGAPALALDPDGHPHVVYGQNALFHAWFDGSAWQTETLVPPPRTMQESAIAIDDAGRIIIAYNVDGKVYVLARPPAGAWPAAVALPLPAGAYDMYELSLALDGDGRPHIAAGFTTVGSESFFHIASETPAGWTVETTGAGRVVSGPIRLALDSQDRPVVLYAEVDSSDAGGGLWLARRDGGGWQHELVAMGCIISGKWLALDAQDKAHIAYSEHCDGQLTYAREGDAGWELIPVTDYGTSPSLALDAQGRPHLVYGDLEDGQFYAVLTDAGWQTTLMRAGENAGGHNTLILDEPGTAHIVSFNNAASYAVNGLEYATNAGGTWQFSKLAGWVTVGGHNALALDVDNTPYAFYDKAEAGELWWGVKTAAGWQTGLLAEVTSLYLEVSADVDSQGRPHVAYADQTADELVVGVREAGAWSLETIEPAGFYLSLAVGSDDSPRLIAVRDGVLTYRFKQGGAWTSEQVGNPASYVSGAWFALDSQDRPHVVYAANNGRFHAVRAANGQWTTEPLPWNPVGLALGPGDKLYVLHTSSRPARAESQYDVITLWAAERAGISWIDTPLAEYAGWWNLRAFIAAGPGDEVYVVYRDVYGDLHLRRRDASGAWPAENQAWGRGEDVGLVVGQDGQPRLLAPNGNSAILWTRDILLLDKHVLLPATMR
jgi:hypothetical protein